VGSLTIEMMLERLVDDLDDGQAVEISLSLGEVYPPPDLARRANEQALRKNVLVYRTFTSSVLLKVCVALAYLVRDRRRHSRTPIPPSASANNSVALGSGTALGLLPFWPWLLPFWPWLLPFWPWLFCPNAGNTGVVNRERHTRLVAKIRRIMTISLSRRMVTPYGTERRCEAITYSHRV
jgi:hypothetical protein